MIDSEVIINLAILICENAERKKDVNKYIDNVHLFLNTLNGLYIPKSKVKEKIKELKNEKEKYCEKQIIQGRIELLEELLEDDEK